jgi:glycosyltransferase involved in cell wall biosynthesis
MEFAAVIPLYNGARYIAETLEGVLSQSYPAAEITVVDDGSSDGGPEVVRRYFPKATVLRLPENSGQQAARNFGITHTKAERIAFCDQDDVWRPDHLLTHCKVLEDHPDLDFTFSNFKILRDGQVEHTTKFDQAPKGYWDEAGRISGAHGWRFVRNIAAQTFHWHPIFPSATVVSRGLLTDVGMFNQAMQGLSPEDGEFTLRCLYKGNVGAVPEPTVLIRRHAGNTSRDQLKSLLDEIRVLGWIREHHHEARDYVDIIDSEISKRRLTALNGAFAAGRHDVVRSLLPDVAHKDRSLSVQVKAALARMPDPIGQPLNAFLQKMSGIIKRQPGSWPSAH